MPRVLTVTFQGHSYQIPEMWLVGAQSRMTIAEAIRWWHEQAMMELEFKAQQQAA